MLVKLFFRMFIFVTLARWLYAEASIVAPNSIPWVESVLQTVQIPTHDRWPKVDWVKVANKIDKRLGQVVEHPDHLTMQISDYPVQLER